MNQLRGAHFNTLTKYQIRGTFKQQLNISDVYANFKVEDIHRSRDYQTICYTMRHQPTQAKYVHFATSSIVNQFALAVWTPAEDECGTPNVVQATINCGSKKYPVRDAWTHMHGRSLQPKELMPYIMADYSVYNVQSPLMDDLNTLIGVTFEQVFRPMFREVDYLQQIRRQLVGNVLSLRGQVYDEMKKQFESPEFIHEESVRKHLTQGTPYQYTAGGVPQYMSMSTFQKAQQYYDKYYNVSNIHLVTSGDIDVLQHCQQFDKLLEGGKPQLSREYTLEPRFQANLQLQGSPSVSFAYRGADLVKNPEEYFQLGLISFLLHDIDGVGLRPLLDQYGAYCHNYGCNTSLRHQIMQIGFAADMDEQELYEFEHRVRNDFFKVVPKDIIHMALERIKLRRSLHLPELLNYIVNDVKPAIYLNQNFDIEQIANTAKEYFSHDKVLVKMKQSLNYIENIQAEESKYLKQIQLSLDDYKQIAEQKVLIDEDNTVLSLESLPKINAANVVPLLKADKQIALDLNFNISGMLSAPKHSQQCNIQWIIDIHDFNRQDLESAYLFMEILPEIFNRSQTANDLQASIIDNKLIFELSCLDKNLNQAIQEASILTDPPLDDQQLLSQVLQVLSAKYINNDDFALLATDYCEQHRYTIVDLGRRICGLEVEILRQYSAKTVLNGLTEQLVGCFFKLMNKDRQQFKVYANPLLAKNISSSLNLMLTNLKLQFDDYIMPLHEFNDKYEIQQYTREFQYIKHNIGIASNTNYVVETIPIEDSPVNDVLAHLLTECFLLQYCHQQQQAFCRHNNGKLTFYTTNDINTVKSYQIFENALHLLIEYVDMDHLNQAKLAAFKIEPEYMTKVLAVTLDNVTTVAKVALQQIADGNTAQVIFGQTVPQLIERGWTIERYVNEVSLY